MEGDRSAFKMSTGKLIENISLGRPSRTWENNIRMHLKEICINTRNLVDLAQDRDFWRALVNAALNLLIL